jgi:O-6-methylguanine DNA methyltransferase
MMNADVDRTSGLITARALRRGLRRLGSVDAPGGLLDTVLNELGLAERYLSVASPIGTIYVAFNGLRISGVAPAEDDASFERTYRARTGRTARRADSAPDALLTAICRHLAGESAELDLDLRGLSEFERAVLLKAREIPRGEVRPYGWIAREIGRPGAVRAVGSALNKNPVPLLIPCHRVVKSDNQIGEYAFGPALKRTLLQSEGLNVDHLDALARAGIRVIVDLASGEYCLPTCGGILERTPSEIRPLPSAAAAQAAGYRPCADCRPVAIAV